MNYIEALTFVFKDKNWIQKVAIGCIFAFFASAGIGLIPLLGWSVEIARRIIQQEEETLANWTQIITYIVNGTKIFIVLLIWSIPSAFFPISVDETTGAITSFSPLLIVYMLVLVVFMIPMLGLLAQNRPFVEAVNPLNSIRFIQANLSTAIGAIVFLVIGQFFIGIAVAVPYLLFSLVLGDAASVLLTLVVPGIVYNFAFLGHICGQLQSVAQQPNRT